MTKQKKLSPKFSIDDLVFYLEENKVHSGKISGVLTSQSKSGVPIDWVRPQGQDGIFYQTPHGVYREELLFPSKEELLASL